jgi:ATP-dependent Lon protease
MAVRITGVEDHSPAKRHGIQTVFIPKDNVRDLEEIDQTVRAALHFVPVENVDQVFAEVFVNPPRREEKSGAAFAPVKREGGDAALRQ